MSKGEKKGLSKDATQSKQYTLIFNFSPYFALLKRIGFYTLMNIFQFMIKQFFKLTPFKRLF